MLHPYTTSEDGTEVVHSKLFEEDGVKKVLVHFERPTASGFDSARCELPGHKWTTWEGHFSPADKEKFERFLKDNAHLIIKLASTDDWQRSQPLR